MRMDSGVCPQVLFNRGVVQQGQCVKVTLRDSEVDLWLSRDNIVEAVTGLLEGENWDNIGEFFQVAYGALVGENDIYGRKKP